MKKTKIGLLIIVLGLVAFFITRSSSDWQTYENTRYEFSVNYPGDWTLGEAPTNNDGRDFFSSNEETSCRAYGFQNALLNEQGNSQTLNEFIDWLSGDLVLGDEKENFVVLERSNTTMASEEAQELITNADGLVARAVYILNEETGRGLVCYYESEKIMEEQDGNFEIMKNSFTVSVSSDVRR